MSACIHERTHPRGCDDCPATWCWACESYQIHTTAQCVRGMRDRLKAAEHVVTATREYFRLYDRTDEDTAEDCAEADEALEAYYAILASQGNADTNHSSIAETKIATDVAGNK